MADITMTLHDFGVDASPSLTDTTGASVIATCTIRKPSLPGPVITEDIGARVLPHAGWRRGAAQRDAHTIQSTWAWNQLTQVDAAALATFYALTGVGNRFWLRVPSEMLPPIPPPIGVALYGGSNLTLGSSVYLSDRVLLDPASFYTFRRAWFDGPMTGPTQTAPPRGSQYAFYDVDIPLRLEVPW